MHMHRLYAAHSFQQSYSFDTFSSMGMQMLTGGSYSRLLQDFSSDCTQHACVRLAVHVSFTRLHMVDHVLQHSSANRVPSDCTS